MEPGYGCADYLLFAGGRSVGALEAKKEGFTLTGVEISVDDFDLTPFTEEGGLGRGAQVFGTDLRALLDERIGVGGVRRSNVSSAI